MGSYKRLPTVEDIFDTTKFTPQRRRCLVLNPFIACGMVFLGEWLTYYMCKNETLINMVIPLMSITFGALIYRIFECLDNLDQDNLKIAIIFAVKFSLSISLTYYYNLVPYLYSSKSYVILFYVLSALIVVYLKYFRTKSWNSICDYSTKHPPLGEALAHQTYEGFYAKILPKIRKEIRKMEPQENIDINMQFIILIPKSGSHTDALIYNDKTSNLEICHNLMVIKEDNGGTVNREYKLRKYRIQRQNEKSQFYCFFEVPSSLINMFKIARQIKDSPEYIWEQYQIYCNTLKYCIEYDKSCIGNYKIIAYNDTKNGGISLPLSMILEKIVDGKEEELNLIM